MWEIILDVLTDTLIDALKMLPFLFGAYLLIEYIEHKSAGRLERALSRSGKWGPIWGSLLGIVPQCGFSVAASNLYASGMVTAGTLIAVFISTSDEAIPVLLAHPGSLGQLGLILLVKLILAILVGILVDTLFKRSIGEPEMPRHYDAHHGHCEHCECHDGIFKTALKHAGSTFLFILIVILVMNSLIAGLGEERLSMLLMTNTIFQPAIAALVGFIPNCAASVVLTELYLSGTLSFGSIIAGLTTSAGVGLVVLFKSNHNLKENLRIIACLYLTALVAGTLIQALFH